MAEFTHKDRKTGIRKTVLSLLVIVAVIIGVAWPHTNREHKLSADPHRSPTGAKKPGPCSMKGWSQDMADTATNGHSGAP